MNGVILAAYFLLYKDLIRLYAVYNEGMINIIGTDQINVTNPWILEKFFSMSKKDCQESLKIYKAFLKRMEHVNQFVKVAEVSPVYRFAKVTGVHTTRNSVGIGWTTTEMHI